MLFIFVGDMSPPPPLIDDVQFGFLDDDNHVVPFHSEEVHANWRIAADSASEFNHTFIHKEDELVKYWKQPLPFAERQKATTLMKGLFSTKGRGQKVLRTLSRM